ncbi:PilZ domain-containing protein [Endozoicomonadaceae bacterium StTr2]
MPERRRDDRSPVTHTIHVFDQDSGQRLGKVVDLSPEGFMLLGDSPVPKDKQFSCRLESDALNDNLVISAECLWSRESSSQGYHWSGFHISEISASAKEQLISLID